MPYEVLARRWRPQVFEDVIGQEHITQTLMNAIKTGRIAHAYLFGGPRGVGKTSVARILAKAINCEEGEPENPCNKCQSCLEITDGSSVDVQEIDGASNRGIDEIRDLRENVRYMPSSSKYRIYIIDEVHMLTLPAFNALLKTLEEPPGHVKFIFATTESHKVPVTILSRCQRFDFKRISLGQIINHLERISREEGIEIGRSGLTMIAREAEGSMRDAEGLLDQVISFTGTSVEDKQVAEILGIIDRDLIFETSGSIIEGSAKRCLEIVDRIYNYGYDLKEFYRALMEQFRNLLIVLIAPPEYLYPMTQDEEEEARGQAQKAGREKLQIFLNFLINREQDLRYSSHPRLILETIMIKMCHLDDFLSFDEILKKIESLEKRLADTYSIGTKSTLDISSEADEQVSTETEKRLPPEDNGGSRHDKDWQAFLAFLSSKSKALSNILKDWQLVKLSDSAIEIASGNQSFSSSYFDDPERYDQLTRYCREFFKRDMRPKIIVQKRLQPEVKRSSNKNSDLPPPIQDILDIFQGEIKEGYPVLETGSRNQKTVENTKEVKR
ncbi:MAG: DNA polymerase III subunit gamma/tau [Pseudomonadota bacterium]